MSIGRAIPLFAFYSSAATLSNNGDLIMDADGEAIAIKFYPHTTSPITDLDFNLDVTYDTGSPNFTLSVESDSADVPSGTVLGAATPEFTHAADGFNGLQTLATNSGNLTRNVPVWLILRRTGGTSLSTTNKVGMRGPSFSYFNYHRGRHYNNTNWTTTAVSSTRHGYIVKHLDGSYSGMIHTTLTASPSSATDIYGDYRHGIRFKSGSVVILRGVGLFLSKVGSPNDLIIDVYEGDTPKYSETVPAASIISSAGFPVWFSNPVALAADTNIYITFRQESDGGSDSADYDSRVSTFNSTYKLAMLPTDYAFIYGDWSAAGSVPSGLTVSGTDVSMCFPLITDPAADLDQAAASSINVECHNVQIQQGFGVVPY